MLTKIDDYIFLTGVSLIEKAVSKLRDAEIGRVLTLLNAPIRDVCRARNIEYQYIFMLDELTEDIFSNQLLEEALDYIEDSVNKGIKIAIHCQLGVSRSPTIVMAYLMRKHKWSVAEALSFVKERRPFIKPNASFIRQLELFEKMGYRCDADTLRQSKEMKKFEFSNNLSNKVVLRNKKYEMSESINYSNEKRYACKKCRNDLFFDFNVLKHSIGGEKINISSDISANCTNKFIDCEFIYLLTPMEWMEMEDENGKLNCPKCREKIGHYIWSGKECLNLHSNGSQCGAYISPWIHLQPAKIDSFEINKFMKERHNQTN